MTQDGRYRHRNQRFSEWEESVVRLAIKAGYVSEQIGNMLGRSKQSIDGHCKHYRIPRRHGVHRQHA